MKKSTALMFTVSTLILAGCCTPQPHAARWEYKVTVAPRLPGTDSLSGTNTMSLTSWQARQDENARKWRDNVQGYLDELGKDGWVLINEHDGTLYLKRPIK